MAAAVVLVTGSSSGIGEALCRGFHQRGDRVIATARRPESLENLKAAGISGLVLDVTDAAAIEQVVRAVQDREGRIDILVNNAGYGLFGPMMDLPPDAIADQFATNVFAPLQLIQAVAPLMKAQQSGLILNIGSVSGVLTTPFAGAYCASKAALHAMSDALRMELAPFGIQVVTVQPGAIASSFGKNARESVGQAWNPESWYAPIAEKVQMRANFSQLDATSAPEFAEHLIERVKRNQLSPTIRIGKKSLQLPLMKRWLPASWLDNLLTKRFGLTSSSLFEATED